MKVPSLLLISVAAVELAQKSVLRHPRRLPHRNNSRLCLLRWGVVSQKQREKQKSKSCHCLDFDVDSPLPSDQAEERVIKVEAFCEDV